MDITCLKVCNGDTKDILTLSLKGYDRKELLTKRNGIVLDNDINSRSCSHRRAGSTSTTSTGTGCESFTTTDDEAEAEAEATNNPSMNGDDQVCECSIKERVTKQLLFNITDTTSATTTTSPGNSNNNSDDAISNSYSDLEADLDQLDATIEQCDDTDKLRYELRKAHASLQRKDEEVERLSKMRQDVASELEDLTASLFEEAHNMVRVANEKQAAAEKALHESNLKVDLLSAEVNALKTLVLTSTPSAPNKHLHPQIDQERSHKHRRCSSTSHFNLNYGRESSPDPGERPPLELPSKDKHKQQLHYSSSLHYVVCNDTSEDNRQQVVSLEVDPILHEEFLEWKRNVSLDRDGSAFLRRVYRDDVDPCLEFLNKDLSAKVVAAIESSSILIEAIGDKSKTMFPKKCALMDVQRQCHYRMNTGPDLAQCAEHDTWHFISMICRNRIIAVCDFRNYLKYIERGLVKSTVHDIYWEIVKLRKDMLMARLGLAANS